MRTILCQVLVISFLFFFLGCASTPPNSLELTQPREKKEVPLDKAVSFENVKDLSLEFLGTHIELKKGPNGWIISHWNGKSITDPRANESLINHLIDLSKIMVRRAQFIVPPKPFPKELKLFLKMHLENESITLWHNPSAPDAKARRSVMIFSEKNQSYYVSPSSIHLLLAEKEAIDFRDRRLTGFETDDVEEILSSGKCKRIWLYRDGNQWVWKTKRPIAQRRTDEWLDRLLSIKYSGTETRKQSKDPQSKDLWCQLEILGRRGKKEVLEIYDENGELQTKNGALGGPTHHHLPQAASKWLQSALRAEGPLNLNQ